MKHFFTKSACFLVLSLFLNANRLSAAIEFDPTQWTLTPNQGTVAFANGNMDLVFTGPTGNFYPSFDFATVSAPVGSYIQLVLNWKLNSGASDLAELIVSVPGQNSMTYDSGGQIIESGSPITVDLSSGQSATILFESKTGEGKGAPTLDLTLFSYVPEPATWWWTFLLVASLGLQFVWQRWGGVVSGSRRSHPAKPAADKTP